MTSRAGRSGEKAAEKRLRRMGMTLLERNLRIAGSEIDLVALDGETIVFVEVKARARAGYDEAAEAVDRPKQRFVVRGARAFLKSKGLLDRPRRYDVATVLLGPKGRPETVDWIRDAFDEGEIR